MEISELILSSELIWKVQLKPLENINSDTYQPMPTRVGYNKKLNICGQIHNKIITYMSNCRFVQIIFVSDKIK